MPLFSSIAALVGLACGGPIVASFFLGRQGKPDRSSCTRGVLALFGLWPVAAYLEWHGEKYGWKPKYLFGFIETTIFLSIAGPLAHGGSAYAIQRIVDRSGSIRIRTRAILRSLRSDQLRRRLRYAVGTLVGVTLGFLLSDLAAPGLHETYRTCTPIGTIDRTAHPLPAARFLLVLGASLVAFLRPRWMFKNSK